VHANRPHAERARHRRLLTAAVAPALLLAACVGSGVPDPQGGGIGGDGLGSLPDVTTTTEGPRECRPMPVVDVIPPVEDAAAATIVLSKAIYPCADRVVVSLASRPLLRQAADQAIAVGAALLVVDAQPTAAQQQEIQRLAPEQVLVYGVDPALVAGPWETVEGSAADPGDPAEEAVPTDQVWLVGEDRTLPLAVAPAAAATGSTLVPVDAGDLRGADDADIGRITEAGSVLLIGAFGPDAAWQLDVVRSGVEIPGGGHLMFPGRRLVALYGSPDTPPLGVLGEQGVAASVTRARELAAGYETGDGTTVLAAFDLIASVASASAGADGDYSAELSLDTIRPWVDAAAEAGIYVILDLQPGRTDFLTQAKNYEELLRLPHVGLALDPEWRLKPDQVHLRQVGTVTGAEVNTVVDWLAGIVREERLPQKLLIVHQFKLAMITERETIRTPPELAVVIQMDGQGPLPSKYGTYDALTVGTDGVGWRWGWKNFYDEDSPTATPAEVLAVEPQPVFISYQ
jgi:hypothetical protein